MLLALLLANAVPSRSVAEARLANLDQAVRAQEAKLAAAEAPLARLLATAERLALRPPAIALAQPRSIEETIRTRALIATLAPAIRRRSAALRREVMATQALRAEAEQQLAAMMEAGNRADDAGQKRMLDRLAGLRIPNMPAVAGGSASGVYQLPAAGTVLVGMSERSDVGVRARGLTLATADGAAVVAPAAGRIAYAGPFRGYGDIVILDHGHGWTTLLAGLELVTATSREFVLAGAGLGHMARKAPRLTIELRHDGRPVDVAAMVLQ